MIDLLEKDNLVKSMEKNKKINVTHCFSLKTVKKIKELKALIGKSESKILEHLIEELYEKLIHI